MTLHIYLEVQNQEHLIIGLEPESLQHLDTVFTAFKQATGYAISEHDYHKLHPDHSRLLLRLIAEHRENVPWQQDDLRSLLAGVNAAATGNHYLTFVGE